MKNTKIKKMISLVLVLSLTNCAALFNSGGKKVSINSTPSGAEVYVGGNYMGKTPVKVKLDGADTHFVKLKYNGKEETYSLDRSLGAGWIILDVLGGLVPVVVDAATGSWYTLKPRNITANFN